MQNRWFEFLMWVCGILVVTTLFYWIYEKEPHQINGIGGRVNIVCQNTSTPLTTDISPNAMVVMVDQDKKRSVFILAPEFDGNFYFDRQDGEYRLLVFYDLEIVGSVMAVAPTIQNINIIDCEPVSNIYPKETK